MGSRGSSVTNTIKIGIGNNVKEYKADKKTFDFFNDLNKSELYNYDGQEYWDKAMNFYKKYQSGVANENNFFYNTMAEFEPVKQRPRRKPDFVSTNREGKISSEYWYTKEGVIRGSDHWGQGIASADWRLKGTPLYNSGKISKTNKRYGKTSWTDFVQKTSLVNMGDKVTISNFNNTYTHQKHSGTVYKINNKFYKDGKQVKYNKEYDVWS